jgi:hypothetical protein
MHHPVMAAAAAAALVLGGGTGFIENGLGGLGSSTPYYVGSYCNDIRDAEISAGEYGPDNVDELWTKRLQLRGEGRCDYVSTVVTDPVFVKTIRVGTKDEKLYKVTLPTRGPNGEPLVAYATDIE